MFKQTTIRKKIVGKVPEKQTEARASIEGFKIAGMTQLQYSKQALGKII